MTTAFQRISPAQAAEHIRRSRAGIWPLALFDSRDEASYAKHHIKGADHLSDRNFGDTIASQRWSRLVGQNFSSFK